MTKRMTRTTVTFMRSFVLAGVDEERPAGVYDIEMDEERLDGLSFSVYRGVLTLKGMSPDDDAPNEAASLR